MSRKERTEDPTHLNLRRFLGLIINNISKYNNIRPYIHTPSNIVTYLHFFFSCAMMIDDDENKIKKTTRGIFFSVCAGCSGVCFVASDEKFYKRSICGLLSNFSKTNKQNMIFIYPKYGFKYHIHYYYLRPPAMRHATQKGRRVAL